MLFVRLQTPLFNLQLEILYACSSVSADIGRNSDRRGLACPRNVAASADFSLREGPREGVSKIIPRRNAETLRRASTAGECFSLGIVDLAKGKSQRRREGAHIKRN